MKLEELAHLPVLKKDDSLQKLAEVAELILEYAGTGAEWRKIVYVAGIIEEKREENREHYLVANSFVDADYSFFNKDWKMNVTIPLDKIKHYECLKKII